LAYLHYEKVIHRDLKSDNVLLLNGHCKLTDFGSSSKHSDTLCRVDSLCEVRGTLVYLAPEMSIERFQVSYSSDVYSFGIVLWEIFNTLAVKMYQTPYHTVLPSLRPQKPASPTGQEEERPVDDSGTCLPCNGYLSDPDSPRDELKKEKREKRHEKETRKKTRANLAETGGNNTNDHTNTNSHSGERSVRKEKVTVSSLVDSEEEEDVATRTHAQQQDDAKVDYALFVLISNGTRPDVPKNFLKRAMALYVNCVGSDPRMRPKVTDVLRHLEAWQKYLTSKAKTGTTATSAIYNSRGGVYESSTISPLSSSSSAGGGWDEVTTQEVCIRLPPVSDL
jgi:serine/threonine protein kinase